MAYYYLTINKEIWKTCGARKVKRIWSYYDRRPKSDPPVAASIWTNDVHVSSGAKTATTPSPKIPKLLIPMMRRTFPELITSEIVGVQPMSGPVGMAFALRHRYEKPYIYKMRNTVPLHQFKKTFNIVFETKYWSTLLFELDSMSLNYMQERK